MPERIVRNESDEIVSGNGSVSGTEGGSGWGEGGSGSGNDIGGDMRKESLGDVSANGPTRNAESVRDDAAVLSATGIIDDIHISSMPSDNVFNQINVPPAIPPKPTPTRLIVTSASLKSETVVVDEKKGGEDTAQLQHEQSDRTDLPDALTSELNESISASTSPPPSSIKSPDNPHLHQTVPPHVLPPHKTSQHVLSILKVSRQLRIPLQQLQYKKIGLLKGVVELQHPTLLAETVFQFP
ncbi:hypothetical protein BC829DRAFT_423252 [Chytridium lagenaria]|nr:hypothetical protein BC829DRAFT_423252 [Chytridium lagenaria]